MKGKHVFHIALFVFALYSGVTIGNAVYNKFLKGAIPGVTN